MSNKIGPWQSKSSLKPFLLITQLLDLIPGVDTMWECDREIRTQDGTRQEAKSVWGGGREEHTAGSPLFTFPEEGASLRVSSVRPINISQVPTTSQSPGLRGIKRWRLPFTLGKDRQLKEFSEMEDGPESTVCSPFRPVVPLLPLLSSFCLGTVPSLTLFTHP